MNILEEWQQIQMQLDALCGPRCLCRPFAPHMECPVHIPNLYKDLKQKEVTE